MKKIITLIAVALVAFACNKTKINSNRLMKAGEWKVTELSVDGTNEDELPHWKIEDCDIYEDDCHGEWENEEGGHALFIWQFREKGKIFEISRQEEAEEEDHDHDHGGHDHAEEEAIEQCYNFSGVYNVISNKKDEMEFESTTTIGHSGKTVKIKISKK